MQRPIFKPLGTPVEELDTPAMVVDLALLEQNIQTVHSFFIERDAKVRPHVEAHRCPAIAHKQMAAGGTAGGISVTTVGEAEVFAQSGFEDIFIASEVVTSQKINRLCLLAQQARVTVAVDNSKNVAHLSEAAGESDVVLNLAVDINSRLGRCGVEPGRSALDLARAAVQAPNVHFAGLMSYEGTILTEDREELEAESRRAIQQVLDTRELIEKNGIPVRMVSAGATHNYDIAGSMSGVTEVPAGSYALMDARYRPQRSELRCAARVLGTVVSVPEPGTAILDLGQKSIGVDLELPVIDDVPGVTVASLSAEHGRLDLSEAQDGQVDLGDKVWLTPWETGTCANLYDQIHVARQGKLVAVWDVAARGQYR